MNDRTTAELFVTGGLNDRDVVVSFDYDFYEGYDQTWESPGEPDGCDYFGVRFESHINTISGDQLCRDEVSPSWLPMLDAWVRDAIDACTDHHNALIRAGVDDNATRREYMADRC